MLGHMLSGHARWTKKRSRPSAKQPPAATRPPSPTGIWGSTYLEALVVVAVAAESCFDLLTEAGHQGRCGVFHIGVGSPSPNFAPRGPGQMVWRGAREGHSGAAASGRPTTARTWRASPHKSKQPRAHELPSQCFNFLKHLLSRRTVFIRVPVGLRSIPPCRHA
jgi:hypothetical protein